MSIETISNKYFLGAKLPNVKILSSKIDEIINAVNAFTTSITTALITATSVVTGKVTVTKDTVTQGTNISTAVTINTAAGVITTVSSTIAAGGTATFTVNNSSCVSGSVILLMADGSNTTGTLLADASNIGNGSFKINIKNIHASAAFNNVLKFHFLIV